MAPNIVVPILGDSFQEFTSCSPGGGLLALYSHLGNTITTNLSFTLVAQYTTWSNAAWCVHTQPPSILINMSYNHGVFELSPPVVARLATSGEVMISIILDKMIGLVGHAFKPFLNGINKYDCPNEKKF